MKTQEPLAEIRNAIEPLKTNPGVLAEASALLHSFFSGKISREQWLEMDGGQRSIIAGAVAGNFAMHHAEECFEMFHCHMRLKDLAAEKAEA